MSEILYPNPNAGVVRVGDTVHCRYTGRPMRVAKKDATGAIWVQLHPTHPQFSATEPRLAYAGFSYVEFEPQFISKEKLEALFDCPEFAI